MTYKILRNGKFLKDGITQKVRVYDTREDAQTFADSCFANDRADWKYQGRRLPKFEVVEA